ncbi:amidohydrolase family protein [Streptomyces sp. NPDC020965]|uniref:amidohydrolase family protein n=1 Tax=Streptomyces sp. NPDC020965 TaxID=3365105 RepID=UPI0037AFA167
MTSGAGASAGGSSGGGGPGAGAPPVLDAIGAIGATDAIGASIAVVDINRMLGPLPYEEVPSRTVAGLVRELDRLRIDLACVTHSHAVHGDPRDAGPTARLAESAAPGPRLVPVPVLIPGPFGTGRPGDERLVRLCPGEHRWPLTGGPSLALAAELARRGIAVLLGWETVTAPEVARYAAGTPELRIVLTGTGYRSARELTGLMDTHPGLSVDTSTLAGHLQVEWFAERHGARRVLFGTGAPVTDDAGPRYQLDTLDLPEPARRLIAGGNALRLLGLAGLAGLPGRPEPPGQPEASVPPASGGRHPGPVPEDGHTGPVPEGGTPR